MHSLELQELTKRFTSGDVLSSISLAIDAGERIAVVGESGSGKTTLLRLIAGLEQPTSGRIKIAGQDVTTWPANRRGVGMVFQDYATYPRLTVAENLTVSLVGGGITRSEKETRLSEMADWLGLSGLLKALPAQLSGGQLQRVAIGKALMAQPKLLLLDEPFSQLDVRLAEQMRRLLDESHQRYGMTQIYVTHQSLDALCSVDKLAVLDRGRLIHFDSPCQVRQRPKSLFAAELTSPCGLNVLPPNSVAELSIPANATVAFRPETIQFASADIPIHAPGLRLRCRLGSEKELGIVRLREAHVGRHKLTMVSRSTLAMQSGDEVELFIRSEDLMIFA